MVRTVTDVRDILGLGFNLILLATLYSVHCSTSISRKIIKVKKGVIVVMKGEKKELV